MAVLYPLGLPSGDSMLAIVFNWYRVKEGPLGLNQQQLHIYEKKPYFWPYFGIGTLSQSVDGPDCRYFPRDFGSD